MFREKWLIVVSLFLGLAAAGGFYIYSSGLSSFGKGQKVQKEEPKTKMIKCIVAKKDIRNREKIVDEMVGIVEVPQNFAHPDAAATKEEVLGRISRDRIMKGEYILKQNLKEKDAPSELSFILPEGKRAITLGASVTGAVGYMVKPGDHVDIVVYLNEKIAGEDISFTLLENMQVLATDMKIFGEVDEEGVMDKVGGSGGNDESYQSVTIAATPEECVRLNLAESIGKMKLTLHSPLETGDTEGTVKIASVRDLKKIAGLETPPENENKSASSGTRVCQAKKTEISVERLEKKDVVQPAVEVAEKKEEARSVYILRGMELDVVRAKTGADSEYAKRGELK